MEVNMALAWFSFTGSNPTLPGHYTRVGTTPPTGCDDIEAICAIQAEENGVQPDITSALLSEMVVALNNQTPSDNVKLKVRPVR